MSYKNLRDQPIELLLERVIGLGTAGGKTEVQAVLAVIARCAIEVSSTLDNAATKLDATADEIRGFNESTTELTNQIIRLNKRLLLATVVIAVASALAAIAAFLSLFKR